MHLFSSLPLSDGFFNFQPVIDLSIQEKNTFWCERSPVSRSSHHVFICVCSVLGRDELGGDSKRSILMNLRSWQTQQKLTSESIKESKLVREDRWRQVGGVTVSLGVGEFMSVDNQIIKNQCQIWISHLLNTTEYFQLHHRSGQCDGNFYKPSNLEHYGPNHLQD